MNRIIHGEIIPYFAWWNPAYLTLNPHLFIPSWYTQASGLFLKPASSCSTSRRFHQHQGSSYDLPWDRRLHRCGKKKNKQAWKSMHPLRWRQNNVRDTAQSGNKIRQCKTSMVSLGKWFTVIVPDLFQIVYRRITSKNGGCTTKQLELTKQKQVI